MKRILLLLLLTGCTLAPKYEAPKPPVTLSEAQGEGLGPWSEFFVSKNLQYIINKALEHNMDLKLATLNVQHVKAQYNISKSHLLPTVEADGGYYKANISDPYLPQYAAGFSAIYELDAFGKVRSLKASALAKFLAEEENRRAIQISIITQTVNTYVELIKSNKELEIARQIVSANNQKLLIFEAKYNAGYVSKEEYISAVFALEKSKMELADYSKIYEENKNALMLLAGDVEILDANLEDIKLAENLLENTPSTNLLNRPDVKKAEQNLIASNADIGAARAAFFPSISLTGNYGYGSDSLADLFTSSMWNFNPIITLPIFTGGKNKAELEGANVRKNIMIVEYEKAIRDAFYESLNALNERKIYREQLELAEQSLQAKKDIFEIAEAKYQNGINTPENAIDTKVLYLQERQKEQQIKAQYIANGVNLYKVFGGSEN